MPTAPITLVFPSASWYVTLAPWFASVVTLLVAFGVYRLTAGREDKRADDTKEADVKEQRRRPYVEMASSANAVLIAANQAAVNPTVPGNYDRFDIASGIHMRAITEALIVGSNTMVDLIAESLMPALDALDNFMEDLQSETYPPIVKGSVEPHSLKFTQLRNDVVRARTWVLAQARIEHLGADSLPSSWSAPPTAEP